MLLFALTAPPGPLPGTAASAEFDDLAAARTARNIVATAPERTPGSEGDAAIAQMVEQHFRDIEGGLVSEQQFDGQFAGHDVGLRNVILTLPGDTDRSVVVMAPRDSGSGPGAASSAAATGVLLELVDELSVQSHTKTLVFVSTDGSSAGAEGAREFATAYPALQSVDAVIDVWQPGSNDPHGPFVLGSSTDSTSASAQLVRTAEHQLSDQTDLKGSSEGTFAELVGLALPSGLGEQAVLIEHGLTAVGLSSAGERPLPPSQDEPDDVSSSTIGDFGRTALLLAVTIDSATTPVEHGPSTYIPLAGNLVPGWALAFLALTLLIPAALASAAGIASGVRQHAGVGWAAAWALSRALPLLAALIFFYFLSLVGLVASPTFPFDPSLFGVGAGQIVVMVLLALIFAGTYYGIRGWRVPAVLPSAAAVPTLGAVSALAVFIAWLANPFLALLLVPTAHVWMCCAGRRGVLPWPFVLGAGTLSLLPLVAALAHVSGSLGSAAPWLLLLMVSDGQFGFGTMLAVCLVGGGLLGLLAVSLRGARRPSARRADVPVRPPLEISGESAEEREQAGHPADPLDARPITYSPAGDDLWDER
ncbi:MAG: M28 family peptidase [Solirubrobacterales bacterium]